MAELLSLLPLLFAVVTVIVFSGRSVGNVGLATELHDLAEDIVAEDVTGDDCVLDQTITDPMATVATMKSEPTHKIFTETRSMTCLMPECVNIVDYLATFYAGIFISLYNNYLQ